MDYRIWEIHYAGSPKTLWGQVGPTPEQVAIAGPLGVQVFPEDTFSQAASSILEKVGNAIGCPPRDVSDRQRELANELEIDITNCRSFWSAYVRIQEAIQLANLDAVRRMELKPGDTVAQAVDSVGKDLEEALGERRQSVAEKSPREFKVSSIREDGQVFFKDGSGQAPARYLEKRTTPELSTKTEIRSD